MVAGRGFTLLEMLLAVLILAVVGTTLSSAIGGVTGQTYTLERRSMAHWIAQNHMVQMRLAQQAEQEAIPEGRDSTRVYMGERVWDVRTEVKSTDHPLIRRVEVEVFEIENDESRGPYEQITTFLGRY